MSFGILMPETTIEPSKSTDQNVADVPIGETISRQDAIEVGNKIVEELSISSIAWDALKCWAKELFDALPSADRPRGEWMSDETVPIEDVWQGVQPLKDKILELEEKLYLQNEKQKAQTINWSHDQISRAEVLALINKAMDNTNNKEIQDYLFRGLRRDVHHLPSVDRPRGNWIRVTNGRDGHECSNCHAYAPSYMSGDEYLSDFCPNCGAIMKSGDAE